MPLSTKKNIKKIDKRLTNQENTTMESDPIQSIIQRHHLVSLNTARIKLRNQHPRISQDLFELFTLLKSVQQGTKIITYKTDGLINIED